MKKVLITGIGGQDGSYLAELLLSKGYDVHGLVRKKAKDNIENHHINLVPIINNLNIHTAAIEDNKSMLEIIRKIKPDECYHLASSSFVSYKFSDEAILLKNNFIATHSLLSAIKENSPSCRVYFAGSSEMFGDARISPQNEMTPFNPRSVYGISKLAAFHLARSYRERHNIYVAAGILYNHESVRRGAQLVTRKITQSVAKIYHGINNFVELGDIDAKRDWGYAPDFVRAMYMMLQQDTPQDYVIATGQVRSVRDFLRTAFAVIGQDYKKYVKINKDYFRPSEVIDLRGDASKAQKELGWMPTKSFDQFVAEMVQNDIDIIKNKNIDDI
jgi:GDPmannose 4,6-dehydratase